MLRRLLPTLTALLVTLSLPPARAQIEIGGVLEPDAVWAADAGPYTLVDEVTVPFGARLTIEPGATVRGAAGVALVVEGTLVAEGAADTPVVFQGAIEGPGSWGGVRIEPGGGLVMRHATIHDAIIGISLAGNPRTWTVEDVALGRYQTYGLRSIAPSPFTLTRVSADGRGGGRDASGIAVFDGLAQLYGGRLHGNPYGVNVANARLTADRVIFDQNHRSAVFMATVPDAVTEVEIDRSTFYGNRAAFASEDRGRGRAPAPEISVRRCVFEDTDAFYLWDHDDPMPRFESYWRNLYAGSRVSTLFYWIDAPPDADSSLSYAALMVDPENGDFAPTDRSPARLYARDDPDEVVGAVPYAGDQTPPGRFGVLFDDLALPAGVHPVIGDWIIAPGARLTLAPGAVLQMPIEEDVTGGGSRANRVEIRVMGGLEAIGRRDAPVRMIAADGGQANAWTGLVLAPELETFQAFALEIEHASLVRLERLEGRAGGFTLIGGQVAVRGGRPRLDDIVIERSSADGLRIWDGADVTASDLIIRWGLSNGVRVDASSLALSDTLVHDNQGAGLLAPVGGENQVELEHITLAHNGGPGISGSRNVVLRSSIVSHNAGAGISGIPSAGCLGSVVWGNGVPLPPEDETPACVHGDPLFVDDDARDFHLTRHSPARGLGIDGSHAGALPWLGAEKPWLTGYLWEDTTLDAADSPHVLAGDLVVAAGVTLTLEPGAELLMPSVDLLGAGADRERAELSVRAGGRLVAGTAPDAAPPIGVAGPPVVLTPANPELAPGSWRGITVHDGGTSSLYNVELYRPQVGLDAIGPTAPRIRYVQIVHHTQAGMRFVGIDGQPSIDVHGAQIVGLGVEDGVGLLARESDGRITGSVLTHHAVGVRAETGTADRAPTLALTNNTFVEHDRAVSYRRAYGLRGGLTVDLFNNIFARNRTAAIEDEADQSVSDRAVANLLFDGDRIAAALDFEQGTLRADPRIEESDPASPPRYWDARVWSTSPAIDAGVPAAPGQSQTDARGHPRALGGGVDIGAYEYDPADNLDPRADAVAGVVVAGRGEAIRFDGSAAFDPDGQIVSARWRMSDGATYDARVAEHAFAREGPGQWGEVTVVDDDGAIDRARVEVTVGIRPIADAGPDRAVALGAVVPFDASNSVDFDGDITAWRWDFGDGSPPVELERATHTFDSAGFYRATLTVTDDIGLGATDSALLTVLGGADTRGPLIEHTPPVGRLEAGGAVSLRATVRDPAGIGQVALFHRPLAGGPVELAQMDPEAGDVYRATLPPGAVRAPGVEYWIVAEDGHAPTNSTASPRSAPLAVWSLAVGPEPAAPTIEHAPITGVRQPGAAVPIAVTLTPAEGASLRAHYRRWGDAEYATAPLERQAGDAFAGELPAPAVGEPGIDYYLDAVDGAGRVIAVDPPGGPATPHGFGVRRGGGAPPAITHTPIGDGQWSDGPVRFAAQIEDPDGEVVDATLQYRRIGAAGFVRVPLEAEADGVTWSITLPAASIGLPGIEYTIEATDTDGRTATHPADAPDAVHRFTTEADDGLGPVIEHIPPPDGQPIRGEVALEVRAHDVSGVASVRVTYQSLAGGSSRGYDLRLTDGVWRGRVPSAFMLPPGVKYFIRAVDGDRNERYSPPDVLADRHSFLVGDGWENGPVVEHEAVRDGQWPDLPVFLDVQAHSHEDIAGVTAWYRHGVDPFTPLPMRRDNGSRWIGQIPREAVVEGEMEYFFRAQDASPEERVARLPADDGHFRFTVQPLDADPPTIEDLRAEEFVRNQVQVWVTANVRDASPPLEVELYAAFDDEPFRAIDAQLDLVSQGYRARVLPLPDHPALLRYYLVARDRYDNEVTVPAGGALDPLTFDFANDADDRPPVLAVSLEDTAPPIPPGEPVSLVVTLEDESDVPAVDIEISAGGVPVANLATRIHIQGLRQATVPGNIVVEPGFVAVARAADLHGNEGRSPPLQVPVGLVDGIPPAIDIEPVPDGHPAGQPVTVVARIVDPAGVASATVRHRSPGDPWRDVEMAPLDDDRWQGTIPGAAVIGAAIEYAVEASDGAGNAGSDPDALAGQPRRFTVAVAAGDPPRIVLAPLPAQITANSPVAFAAVITSPAGITSARLLVSSAATDGWIERPLVVDGDRYTAVLPGPIVVEPEIAMVVYAEDAAGADAVEPPGGEGDPLVIPVAPRDPLAPPSIAHVPPADGRRGEPLPISAVVTDGDPIVQVTLIHRVGDGDDEASLALLRDGDIWRGAIPAEATEGDAIEYRLEALDAAGAIARAPDGWYRIPLRAPDPQIPGPQPEPEPTIDVGFEGCACDAADGGSAPFGTLLALALVMGWARRRGRST